MTPNIRRNERPETGGVRSRNRLAAAALRLSLLLTALVVSALALPATALAAGNAPTTLYVGNYQITNGNATTYLKTGSTQGSLVEGSENDWTVKYVPSTATLTLNGATITGNDIVSSVPYGAGIYAQSKSGQPVTLTIELIGENAITGASGIYVDAELSVDSYGTDASLNITGNGSLVATGTNGHGIFVKSGTGNASLTINDASVVANTTQTYSGFAGVCVQSSVFATSSPILSLAVDGGSLTASGTGNSDGILLYVGLTQATGATTNLTVTDNAIVDARNGGISASRISETLPTPTPTGDNSSGIVFDGSTGTVYGDVTLDESLTINEGETLTIPQGSTLNTGDKLTNNGTINVESGGKLEGTPVGDVVYAPIITVQPTNQTVTEGETATFTVSATGNDLSYQWQQKTTGGGDGWTNVGSPTSSNTYTIDDAKTSMSGYQYRCIVSNSAGSVESNAATLAVGAATVSVTSVSLDQSALTLTESGTAQLTATVRPNNATNQNVTWSSSNQSVATVENGKVTAVGAGSATITVTTEDGGKSATCTVTVVHVHDPVSAWSRDADGHWHACAGCNERVDFAKHSGKVEGKRDATCTEDGYTGDTVCSVCGYAIAKGETIPATGHSFTSYAPNGDATCTEDGTETAACDNGCGAADTRPDEGSALGHAWGEPAWRWSDDGEEFVASFACARDASHTIELTAKPAAEVASEPTCTKPGTTRYRAEVELDGVTYAAEATAADIPALGHRFEDGVCTVCGAEDEGYVAPQRPDPRPESEPVETNPELPATGDATAVVLLGALACGGAALAIGAALRMRSR